jgi:hypothetical protein
MLLKNRRVAITMVSGGIIILLILGYRLKTRIEAQNTPNVTQASHQRPHPKQQSQTGQPGSDEGSGQQGKGASKQQHHLDLHEGLPGSEQIAVIVAGKEKKFTGTDLKTLEPMTVATRRGAWKGWPAAAVLQHIGVAQAKELTFVNKTGEHLNVSWEKLTAQETSLILTYNRGGGLLLLSGVPMTAKEVETGNRRSVKSAAMQDKEKIFLPNIVKIEVKT